MKKISYAALEKRLPEFLQKYFDADAASKCAEVILYAERRGIDGQGLLKLSGSEPLQSIKSVAPLEVVDKTPVSALINGNKQPSFHIAQAATDAAIAKAIAGGVGIVGANGIFSSTGALGFYAEKIANNGLVGIIMARSPGAMTPFGTTVPLFGTNPLAFSFPTLDDPLVFDMATSAITWYELVIAKMRGQNIPEGVAIDKNGNVTTNPTEAMNGGILPFDKSYKGSALSLWVEMMSGPIVGAAYCDCETFDKDWGFFVLAFRPDLLVDTEEFKKHASELLKTVRSKGASIRLPGDGGHAHERKVLQTDRLEIDDEIAVLLGL